MICKTILLDLDNTLYNYDTAHKKSLNKVEAYCVKKFNITKQVFQENFKIARKYAIVTSSNFKQIFNKLKIQFSNKDIVVVKRIGNNKQYTNYLLPKIFNYNEQYGDYFVFYNK